MKSVFLPACVALALGACASDGTALDLTRGSVCAAQARTGVIESPPGAQAFAATASAPIAGQDPSAGLDRLNAGARVQANTYDRCTHAEGQVRGV